MDARDGNDVIVSIGGLLRVRSGRGGEGVDGDEVGDRACGEQDAFECGSIWGSRCNTNTRKSADKAG